MADNKQQALDLVAELEVDESIKQKLRGLLEKNGPDADFFAEARIALADSQAKLDRLKKLEEEEQAQLAQAYDEFDREMGELDEDAAALDKAVNKAVEEQELGEARSKIASQ